MSGFIFKERGECVLGVFDWFGELSEWCEGKCRGIKCNEVTYEENNKRIKKLKG